MADPDRRDPELPDRRGAPVVRGGRRQSDCPACRERRTCARHGAGMATPAWQARHPDTSARLAAVLALLAAGPLRARHIRARLTEQELSRQMLERVLTKLRRTGQIKRLGRWRGREWWALSSYDGPLPSPEQPAGMLTRRQLRRRTVQDIGRGGEASSWWIAAQQSRATFHEQAQARAKEKGWDG